MTHAIATAASIALIVLLLALLCSVVDTLLNRLGGD